jgi:undecaprenyl-diphosphatase
VALIAFASITFALLLEYADREAVADTDPAPEARTIADLTLPRAFVWGIFQAMALIPGVSRSGIVLTAARSLGATRKAAAHFGSLMAVPIALLAAAAAVHDTSAGAVDWHNAFSTMAVGLVTSFAAGLAGLHVLVGWCSKNGYLPFVLYRVGLGALLLLALAIHVLS